MDLPRLEALSKYWAKTPPVHFSMAAYVGWGKSKGSAEGTMPDGDLEELFNRTPMKGE
jgi:hypothetical protein